MDVFSPIDVVRVYMQTFWGDIGWDLQEVYARFEEGGLSENGVLTDKTKEILLVLADRLEPIKAEWDSYTLDQKLIVNRNRTEIAEDPVRFVAFFHLERLEEDTLNAYYNLKEALKLTERINPRHFNENVRVAYENFKEILELELNVQK